MNFKELILDGFKFHIRPPLHNESDYSRRQDTKQLVVHCADTKANWDGGAEEIRDWHINERKWMDIGYHFVIRRDGTIENGRPAWSVGAGVAGYNGYSIHICLVGGQAADGTAENNFTTKQFASLAYMLATIKKRIAPNAQVLGHRDFPGVTKACPSFDAIKWWGAASTIQEIKGFSFEQSPVGEQFMH